MSPAGTRNDNGDETLRGVRGTGRGRVMANADGKGADGGGGGGSGGGINFCTTAKRLICI